MQCKSCMAVKPLDGFYASNKSRCKECVRASVTAHRNANLDKVRAYDKLRSSMPHRVAARIEYMKTDSYAKNHKAASLRWIEKHPERRRANTIVGNAIRDGLLKRHPCWVCGMTAQAHHPDYTRPLDVVWLCNTHHKQVHAESDAF